MDQLDRRVERWLLQSVVPGNAQGNDAPPSAPQSPPLPLDLWVITEALLTQKNHTKTAHIRTQTNGGGAHVKSHTQSFQFYHQFSEGGFILMIEVNLRENTAAKAHELS